jgi:fructose-specific phosphotransferase system component IIB
MRIHTPLFVLVAAFLCGCSHTYISGGLNRTSPDGRFELQIESDGANGHGFGGELDKVMMNRGV